MSYVKPDTSLDKDLADNKGLEDEKDEASFDLKLGQNLREMWARYGGFEHP